MSKRPATSASVFVIPSAGSALLGVVVTGATVGSAPDPDELHALATTAVESSAGTIQRRRRRPGPASAFTSTAVTLRRRAEVALKRVARRRLADDPDGRPRA